MLSIGAVVDLAAPHSGELAGAVVSPRGRVRRMSDYWPKDATVAVNWRPDSEDGESGTLDVALIIPPPLEYITIEISEGQQ